jgi:L-ribulose-5-phosphate 3-epimerase
MEIFSRRRFLGVSAASAALAPLAPLWAGDAKSRWFKIGACEWSLGKSDPSCFALAKEIGLDGVQIDLGRLKSGLPLFKPEVQKSYLAAAKAAGMEIASLAMAELNSIPLKRDPRAAKWLADSIDVCKALGLTIVMPAFFGAGDLDMNASGEIDHVVKVVKEVAQRAEKEGIVIALENYLSAAENIQIIERIGSPAVKVYYDVGNSTDKGRNVYREIRQLGKLICQFHAKDGNFVLGQKGRIDFKRVREAIDAIGYNGWIVLESARPKGVVPDYTAQRKFLRTIFPEKA